MHEITCSQRLSVTYSNGEYYIIKETLPILGSYAHFGFLCPFWVLMHILGSHAHFGLLFPILGTKALFEFLGSFMTIRPILGS